MIKKTGFFLFFSTSIYLTATKEHITSIIQKVQKRITSLTPSNYEHTTTQ